MSVGKLFVISGASGVGKSTVLERVMAARKDLVFSVSATTRNPRPGEIDGVSYYFVDKQRFAQMIADNAFLEYDEHHNTFYGTPAAQLEEKLSRGNVILDIDPNGAFHVREKRPDATLIFVNPPTWESLETRLRSRGDTSPEQVETRLNRAKWEMEQGTKYDYTVINDKVEDCAQAILNIIAEKAD